MNYRSLKTSRGWFRRVAGFIVTAALTLGILGGISACARRDVAVLSDRQPGLDLAEFFAGDSVAYGIFEDRFGNLRRQFRVNMTGTVEGDTLTLVEDFLYDDGERADRTWVIRRTGTDDRGIVSYEGTAADVTGTARGRVAGNALNWEYDVVLNMSGSEVKVHFDDWIYRQDEDVAINRAFISKFGIEIGSVTIVFLRGDTAAAVGPLDLETWPE
ncbi:MAG: hypothetical protein CNE93_04500 [SAR116 cluster bacterium MED-G06]|nr:MAG: hypothetical protein CNE93_04500 [SAR116 cluster bacterium MED-G06]|tara:strand:- start:2564 stop:3208 length:645 start_codon:yes stop_codon:yes gene_type:complete